MQVHNGQCSLFVHDDSDDDKESVLTIDVPEATLPGDLLFQADKTHTVDIPMTLSETNMAAMNTALFNLAVLKNKFQMSVECACDLSVDVLHIFPLSVSGIVFTPVFDKETLSKKYEETVGLANLDGLQALLPDDLQTTPKSLWEYFLNRNEMKPSYHVQRTFHWAHLLPESVGRASVHVPPLTYDFGVQDGVTKWRGEMSGFSIDFANKVQHVGVCARMCVKCIEILTPM